MFFGEQQKRREVSKTEKQALYAQQGERCMYCGIQLESAYLHIDHKTPFARGGSDTFGNLQLLCGPCNTRKSTMTDGEFRKRYKLVPSGQVVGPPTEVIQQSHFIQLAKEAKKRDMKNKGEKTSPTFGSRKVSLKFPDRTALAKKSMFRRQKK